MRAETDIRMITIMRYTDNQYSFTQKSSLIFFSNPRKKEKRVIFIVYCFYYSFNIPYFLHIFIL